MENKKNAQDEGLLSERSARDNWNKLDSDRRPTSDPRQFAFGYVANTEDIIIRDKASKAWLLLVLGALIALGMSIAAYRASNVSQHIPIVLLILPWLQLLAMAAVWLWVRDRSLPHVWVRGYSPQSPVYSKPITSSRDQT